MAMTGSGNTQQAAALVVGIGASAGGLPPLRALIASLPAATAMSFIVVTHSDPEHSNLLHELLAADSALPISVAQNDQPIEPGKIYVVPPGTCPAIADDRLRLVQPGEADDVRHPVDHLFRALARACGNRCAGIILSGPGSDGATGLREIKAAGGLALVQDPEEAGHASMPNSALRVRAADRSVPVNAIHRLLRQFVEHPLAKPPAPDEPGADDGSLFPGSTDSRSEQIRRAIFRAVVPATVLIDGDDNIVYCHGNLAPYLVVPEGEPRQQLSPLLNPALRSKIRSGLHQVRKARHGLNFRAQFPRQGEGTNDDLAVRIDIELIGNAEFTDGDAFVIVFREEQNTIEEHRQLEQTAVENEHKLRLAISTNKIGSFEFFLETGQMQWDALLHEIWGIRADERLTREMFWEALHPDDADMVASELKAALDPGGSGEYRTIYRVINRQSGAVSWVAATGKTRFANGKALKMIGLVTDITESKETEFRLQDAIRQLRDVDRKKNEFLSILGHELRNPLSVLSGSLEVFRMTEARAGLPTEVMMHAVTTMARLLDDLLDLERISRSKIRLDTAEVDLRDVLGNVVKAIAIQCDRKQQSVRLNAEPGLMVKGDSIRLEQIFTNLIINASKYTPAQGEIAIDARADGPTIRVTMRDTGSGIARHDLERIFDPFFQIKTSGQAMHGLGIGLALAKQLVEMHGGTISADSDGLGHGAVFTVTLPALPPGPRAAAHKPYESRYAVKRGLRILLIEDYQDKLRTMIILLKALGCEVVPATTGREGLDCMKSFRPDAIIVDIGLPDISGHEVARIVRADGYRGLIIALSGYSHKEARDTSREVGIDHHLAKPTTVSQIAAALSSISAAQDDPHP